MRIQGYRDATEAEALASDSPASDVEWRDFGVGSWPVVRVAA